MFDHLRVRLVGSALVLVLAPTTLVHGRVRTVAFDGRWVKVRGRKLVGVLVVLLVLPLAAVHGTPQAVAGSWDSRTPPYDFGCHPYLGCEWEPARYGLLSAATVTVPGVTCYCLGCPGCVGLITQRSGSTTGIHVDVGEGTTVEVRVRFTAVLADTLIDWPRVCVEVRPFGQTWELRLSCGEVVVGGPGTVAVRAPGLPSGTHAILVYTSGYRPYSTVIPYPSYGGGAVAVEENSYHRS